MSEMIAVEKNRTNLFFKLFVGNKKDRRTQKNQMCAVPESLNINFIQPSI